MDGHTTKHTSARDSRRAHVVIPRDLLEEVDALVGPRRRSEFFVDAVREKVAHERLRQAAHAVAGSLKDDDIPGWETPEVSSSWVRRLRVESDERAFSRESEE